jgi:hypothetical protein
LIIRRLSLNRLAPIAALAAVLAIAVAVTPSFAGSFLSSRKAARLYVSHKEANHLFLKKQGAAKTYLTQRSASKEYAPAATAPVAAASVSNAVFGPSSSTTPVDIPTSGTKFELPDTGLVKLTFTGASNCTGDVAGVPCPVALLVDGLSVGQVPFDVTGAPSQAHSITLVTVLTAGEHVATAQFAGSSDTSVNFKLTSWNLFAEGFPGQ